MKSSPKPLVFALTAALALAIVAAPGAQQRNQKGKKSAVPVRAGQTVWPLPPETPRIRYVTTYHGVSDFEKKKPRWQSLLLGPDAPKRIEALVKPYGVSVSNEGVVYVTDTGARRVFVFDAAAKSVSFLGDEGTGRVSKPIGVALDDTGKAFVADATLKRIFGYTREGSLAIAIGHEGELENPSGMAVDHQQKLLYVADSKKHKIFCYSTVDGSAVREIGKRGGEPGEFNFPTNLFVDRQSHLYVADTLNFRVQVFDGQGKFLRSFGSLGDTPGRLNRPKGVGVDSEGHIYVADTSFNNFQIFDQEGNLLLFVGTAGAGPGEFLMPAGLFVDAEDRIYVADQGNARVQVFQYLKAPAKQ